MRLIPEFIYCGTVLENDSQSLQEYGVRSGTMIQVFQKQYDMEYKSEQATSEQIHKAVSSYRTIFKEMASSSTVWTYLFFLKVSFIFSYLNRSNIHLTKVKKF